MGDDNKIGSGATTSALYLQRAGLLQTLLADAGAMIRRNSKSDMRASHQVTIRLLDDNEVLQVDFQQHHTGQYLMDYVCRQLNIAEKDYFGLRFVDLNKQRHWLNLGKPIVKQLKDTQPFILCLRFKFYPADPMLLKEDVSRYQLVLQLRRDILHGRLHSTVSDMATLASFIVQSELGDYDPDVHVGNYVAEYELVSRQSSQLEEKVMELHEKLKGLAPGEADVLFLKKAATLDTYGVDPHPVKDQQGEQVYLGINHTGISTFQGSRKSTHFKWSQITKLNYEAKMFILHLSIPEDSRNKKKETVGFKCPSSTACKHLWRCAVEKRLFYNSAASEIQKAVRGGGILFGSKFRYSGRVQREILEDPGPLRALDSVISRTPLYRSLQRSKTGGSLPQSPNALAYATLPRSNHSAIPLTDSKDFESILDTLAASPSLPLSAVSSPYCPEHTLPLLETLEEDSPLEEKEQVGDESKAAEETTATEKTKLTYAEVTKMSNGSVKHADAPSSTKLSNGISENHKAFVPVFHVRENKEGPTIMEEAPKHNLNVRHSTPSKSQSQNMVSAVWKIFIVCLICVLLALLVVAILAIEVDVDICQRMRRIPEVEMFQTELYEPLKLYITDKFHNVANNINFNWD